MFARAIESGKATIDFIEEIEIAFGAHAIDLVNKRQGDSRLELRCTHMWCHRSDGQ
jgi:hypothetical protein